jgi:hypothetical protein
MVIRTMINFDVDTLRDCFHQEVQWTLAIRYHLLTLSLHLIWTVYSTFQMLWYRKKMLIICQ